MIIRKFIFITCLVVCSSFIIGCTSFQNDYTWSSVQDKSEYSTLCASGCDYYFDCSNDDSMRPTFSCHNTLYFSRPSKYEINVGDIILFVSGNQKGYPDLTVHRVVAIENGYYKTKGDNHNNIDPFNIPYESVLGKVWRIDA